MTKINLARQLIECGISEEARAALEKEFPELKESEDERIRKEIYNFLIDMECKKEWIAYLEKQKELTRENVIKELEKEFYACATTPKWFHNAMQGAINYGKADALGEIKPPTVVSDELRRQERENAISQLEHLNDVYIGEEKQKEPKPVEWEWPNLSNCIKNCKKCQGKCFYRKESYEEQKPAEKLSKEEHVKKFKALCDAYEIKLPNREYDIYGLCEDLHKLFGDIQKPAEWSEEEKGILLECISALQNSSHWVLADKLSSIRPQPHWKPSEEQMDMLKRWLLNNRFEGDPRYVYSIFESLYNDLKKL